MKNHFSLKHLSLYFSFLLLLASCKKSVDVSSNATTSAPVNKITKRVCGSYEVLQKQLAADPGLRSRMNSIETFTRQAIQNSIAAKQKLKGTIVVPVVVNVLYNAPGENISDEQIQSQIDVLNEDYNNTNADAANVPSIFQPVDAAIGVHFKLASVVRKQTTQASWPSNDAMKSTAQGGIDPIEPDTNLNIWVCNLGDGLLGYSQFPGGNSATDGVVILYSAFGRTGNLIPQFSKGRTATHEIGHWMNLRHIWGDAECGDDYVDDTPSHDGPNAGLPVFPKYSTCYGNPVEMTMNYMDYTDDAGMDMFTNGQKNRMVALFVKKGPRDGFVVKH